MRIAIAGAGVGGLAAAALLDAAALALALQQADAQDPLSLQARARRARVAYQALSAAFTPQYRSDSRLLPLIRDRLLTPLSQVLPVAAIQSALAAGHMVPPFASLDRRPDSPSKVIPVEARRDRGRAP